MKNAISIAQVLEVLKNRLTVCAADWVRGWRQWLPADLIACGIKM